MGGRPRIALVGGTPVRGAEVRRWLLESGADVVDASDAGAVGVVVVDAAASGGHGVPVLDAARASRGEVAAFVRALAGKRPHAFDDHGSGEAWPRGSY